MKVYYNEFDRKAAAWLRILISADIIADGDVDERSICDVQPHELAGYAQCHFFAGIGGWSFALRLAGWPDDRPVWTGSCPCQPFSTAGKRKGSKDERHLWPKFYDLISFGAPPVVFGEQVASKAGRLWLDGVSADLEGLGFAVGASDLCAASVGAPNIRQRFFWVANAVSDRLAARSRNQRSAARARGEHGHDTERCGCPGGMADAELPAGERLGPNCGARLPDQAADGSDQDRRACALAYAPGPGLEERNRAAARGKFAALKRGRADFWDDFELIPCADGKARRIEPGSFPLAHGVPGRVGLLRGYGNAINPWLAAEFILASEESGVM